jgi:serpin B
MPENDDRLPERVQADIARWRENQPELGELNWEPPSTVAQLPVRYRDRRLVRLGAAASVVAIATGVVLATTLGGDGTSNGGAPVAASLGVKLVGHVQPVALGSLTAKDIASAQSAFGLDLLARRCTNNPTANDVLSPASAALALTMLDAGAGASTRTALSSLLHLPPWSPQVIAALHGQNVSLAELKQVKVSNHLYTQLGVHPKQQVLDDLATATGADLQTLDFARQAAKATDAINAQVNSDTGKLIPKLFNGPLDPSTTTVLTNAIYLNAAWKTPFSPASAAPFTTAAGREVQVQMMSTAGDLGQVRHSGGWTSATLPYAGDQLEAVVLLPDNPAAASCSAPAAAQLAALTSGKSVDAPVEMPKLDLSQTSQLTGDLAAMGLPLDGDYSGFGTSGAVSEVVQKTVLQVDEHGTKAAAATGIGMTTSLNTNQVTANRPYLLLIRDTATGTPLFFARISDPTATG